MIHYGKNFPRSVAWTVWIVGIFLLPVVGAIGFTTEHTALRIILLCAVILWLFVPVIVAWVLKGWYGMKRQRALREEHKARNPTE